MRLGEPGGQADKRWRRRALARLVALAVLFGAGALAIDRLVPGADSHLRAADPGWIALGVAVEALALAGYAVLFHATFSLPERALTPRRSGEIAIGELAGFAIVPAGLGGPALRLWALRKASVDWRRIAVRTIVHAAVFNAPYVAAAVALGTLAALRLMPGHAPLLVALAPLALVAGSVALALGAARLASARFLRRGSRRRRAARAGLSVVPEALEALPGFARRPAGPLGALAWWVGDCAVLWAAFHACGGSPPIAVLALAYMLGQLGNLLPLPGGIGGVEPLMLGIFVSSGADAGLAGAAIVCYRAIALGLQTLAGGAAVASLVPALRSQPAEPATLD